MGTRSTREWRVFPVAKRPPPPWGGGRGGAPAPPPGGEGGGAGGGGRGGWVSGRGRGGKCARAPPAARQTGPCASLLERLGFSPVAIGLVQKLREKRQECFGKRAVCKLFRPGGDLQLLLLFALDPGQRGAKRLGRRRPVSPPAFAVKVHG